MKKTVIQSLLDETLYPIPVGKVENIIITRDLDGDTDFTKDVTASKEYKGALADCLYSLLQAITFSEAGMSVGALTDAQRKSILKRANKLYGEIGEEEKDDPLDPKVFINC
jgi:hypothetical protein